MRVEGLLDTPLIDACIARLGSHAAQPNSHSDRLHHTHIGEVFPEFARIETLANTHIAHFGTLLFGEALDWRVKEIWSNVLSTGGHQGVHAHANSFVSGIIYLTAMDKSAHTVFHRSMGGRDFLFNNDHSGARIGPYNGSKWVLPAALPGDMVLYPSYLLHEVPTNQGGERMTIAFNAIPDRLDSWGYQIGFKDADGSGQD